MTFIAVRCPHCQSDQIVKRGKTARGTQRYLCQNTLCARGSFLPTIATVGACLKSSKRIIDMSSQRERGARYRTIVAYLSQHRTA